MVQRKIRGVDETKRFKRHADSFPPDTETHVVRRCKSTGSPNTINRAVSPNPVWKTQQDGFFAT